MKTEQRDQYHCFIVLMRYETSILLGCHSQQVRIIYIPVGLSERAVTWQYSSFKTDQGD